MAINNVESTLPDRVYIAALEAKLSYLEGLMEQIRQDQLAARS